MQLILNRESNQIKYGFSSRAMEMGLAAHGYSPEMADKNLERVVRRFLAPFEREGVLVQEVTALGLEVEEDGEAEVQIVFKG